MRAAIYVRISRDRIGAGLGVDRQEADCRELAARLGYTVAEVYVDNDISASGRRPRPAYLRLLADIGAGLVDVVLAWHTDRLHRSPTELETYIDVCKERGVTTHTVRAGALDLSTPTGQMTARIVGAVARHEIDHQAARQQRKKLEVAAAGKWGGGRRPFGYKADGVTKEPAEAAELVAATDAILNGSSLRALVASLNKRGITTSTGRPWEPPQLRQTLMRARNAGLREHKGEITGPAEWPALVSEEKWRAVVSILGDPARRTSFSTARKWLLSNIARCGACGDHLRVSLLSQIRSAVPSYTCKSGKCVVRNAAEVENLVERVMVATLSRPDAIDLLRPARPGVDIVALRAEVKAVRRRLDDLADDLDIDERTMARRAAKLRERLTDLEQQQTEAGRGNLLSGVVDADDVAAAWYGLHLDRKRAIIAELCDVVVNKTKRGRPKGWKPGQSYFDPSTVDVIWKR